MASNYKILGQAAPSANAQTDIYTVPANTEAVISTIVIANRATVASTFRLAVIPSGETLAAKHYVAYDVPVEATDSTTLTIGVTLSAGDKISAESTDNDLFSYNVFGSEIT